MKTVSARTKKIIIAALVLIILICMAALCVSSWKKYRAQETYEHLKTAAVRESSSPLKLPEWEAQEKIPLKERYESFPEVDFAPLWEINEEVCGWIRVPGTDVDYPILRNGDAEDLYDTYYLNTTIDGMEGLPGAIYMEPCNSPEFTDYNTVIYGHNMANGAMFTSLHRYREEGFLEEHPYVYIVTPEKKLVYEIASAVVSDDRHIMYSYDFEKLDDRQAFLELLAENSDERSQYRADFTPESAERILTLSTCIGNEKDRRFLVTAVLKEEE